MFWPRLATADVVGIQQLASLHCVFFVIPQLAWLGNERLLDDELQVARRAGRIFLPVDDDFGKIFKKGLYQALGNGSRIRHVGALVDLDEQTAKVAVENDIEAVEADRARTPLDVSP